MSQTLLVPGVVSHPIVLTDSAIIQHSVLRLNHQRPHNWSFLPEGQKPGFVDLTCPRQQNSALAISHAVLLIFLATEFGTVGHNSFARQLRWICPTVSVFLYLGNNKGECGNSRSHHCRVGSGGLLCCSFAVLLPCSQSSGLPAHS